MPIALAPTEQQRTVTFDERDAYQHGWRDHVEAAMALKPGGDGWNALRIDTDDMRRVARIQYRRTIPKRRHKLSRRASRPHL